MWLLSFASNGVRHAAHTETPGAVGPGAIPTVDFLLSHFRNSAKNDAVKSHVWRDLRSLHRLRQCPFRQH
jgi:hypothetical protein